MVLQIYKIDVILGSIEFIILGPFFKIINIDKLILITTTFKSLKCPLHIIF